MSIDHSNPFVTAWDQKLAPNQLFDCKDDAIFAPYSDGGSAVLDSFSSIFYLEIDQTLISEELSSSQRLEQKHREREIP